MYLVHLLISQGLIFLKLKNLTYFVISQGHHTLVFKERGECREQSRLDFLPLYSSLHYQIGITNHQAPPQKRGSVERKCPQESSQEDSPIPMEDEPNLANRNPKFPQMKNAINCSCYLILMAWR
jgi:hypothetical protein